FGESQECHSDHVDSEHSDHLDDREDQPDSVSRRRKLRVRDLKQRAHTDHRDPPDPAPVPEKSGAPVDAWPFKTGSPRIPSFSYDNWENAACVFAIFAKTS